MSSKILVLNSGSSSVKYRLFKLSATAAVESMVGGVIERIGEPGSAVADHRIALEGLVRGLESDGSLRDEELVAVGHRVVHGGESFDRAVRIDTAVVSAIEAAVPLAPLHNPANLAGIQACQERWPAVPQVAVFDTAFHQTMPESAYRYAIPAFGYTQEGIRRYGFHGTSFAGIVHRLAAYLNRPADSLNLIVLHLGNGASACAIENGHSIDTSMGMTPMAGLMMGTRCGDLDPGVLLFWLEQQGRSPAEVSCWLNRESGLKGVAGTNDMRDILQEADSVGSARLALDMYVHGLRHYIGAYRAQLPRLDALVFTGGIGEHAAPVRSAACRDLSHLGIVLDESANRSAGTGVSEIQALSSPVRVMIVPSDEEGEIARQTIDLLQFSGSPSDLGTHDH